MILEPELIPRPLERRNAHGLPGWKAVSADVVRTAGGQCAICRTACDRLHCHERWAYDEPQALATVTALVAVCGACHEVLHMGRAEQQGRLNTAVEHFARVNQCSISVALRVYARARRTRSGRNRITNWRISVSQELMVKYPALAALTPKVQPLPLFD